MLLNFDDVEDGDGSSADAHFDGVDDFGRDWVQVSPDYQGPTSPAAAAAAAALSVLPRGGDEGCGSDDGLRPLPRGAPLGARKHHELNFAHEADRGGPLQPSFPLDMGLAEALERRRRLSDSGAAKIGSRAVSVPASTTHRIWQDTEARARTVHKRQLWDSVGALFHADGDDDRWKGGSYATRSTTVPTVGEPSGGGAARPW